MLIRRVLRLVVLVLVTGVAVVASAEGRPVELDRGAAIAVASTAGDVAVVPSAVSDPSRLAVPVGMGGASGALVVLVVVGALLAASARGPAAVGGRWRR